MLSMLKEWTAVQISIPEEMLCFSQGFKIRSQIEQRYQDSSI